LRSLRRPSRLALGAARRRIPKAIAAASPLDNAFQLSTFIPSAEIWRRCRPPCDPPVTDDAHHSVAHDVLS
jgi:hypothetical protein